MFPNLTIPAENPWKLKRMDLRRRCAYARPLNDQSATEPILVVPRSLSIEHRNSIGDPGVAASNHRASTKDSEAQTHGCRPAILALALPILAEMEVGARHRQTEDRH